MSNTVRIKRSTSTDTPTTLQNAELAYSESSDKLFIGVGTGGAGGSATTILPIGGAGHFLTKTLAGTTYQTQAGMSSYLTTSTAASTYQTQSGMSSYLTTASAGSTYAPLASPTFTGTVTIPAGASISGYLTTTDASSTYQTQSGMSSYLTTSTASSTYAPLASPALTGSPTAPTQTSTDNSTKIATTAFVATAVASATVAATTSVIATVRNETGATLTKGTVVYISGAASNKALVAKAQANGESTSASTYGIVQNDISNNNNGTVVIAGIIENIDTSAFVAGTILYLSPTTAGGLTSTKPSAPNHMVYIGVVSYQHANQGAIQMRLVSGYEIEELHNVAVSSATDLDLLAYESSTSLWKNKSYSTLGLLTSATAASTYQTQSGMSSYLTTSSASSTYAPKASPTFTGTVTIPAGASISGYAPLASPTFTGVPAVPTATAGTNTTQAASTAFVQTAVANLVASAPAALDTLNELATALGNDASFSTTITTSIGTKLTKSSNLSDLTSASSARTNLGLGTMAVQNASSVAITGGTIDGVTIDGGTF